MLLEKENINTNVFLAIPEKNYFKKYHNKKREIKLEQIKFTLFYIQTNIHMEQSEPVGTECIISKLMTETTRE